MVSAPHLKPTAATYRMHPGDGSYIDLLEKKSYIVDTQSIDGTVDLAVTKRMRCDLSNFRQLAPWVF